MDGRTKHIAAVFNEWARRYAEDPDGFDPNPLDEDGNAVEDYGESCAVYFVQIERELFGEPLRNRPVKHVIADEGDQAGEGQG